MKKILIFIDWFLPGYKAGGPVRSVANMVEHLNNEFEFYVVTRDTDYLENIPYYNVVSNNWNNFIPNVKVYYADDNNSSLKQWRRLIREIKPDVVYINGIYSKYFSIYPLIAAKLEKIKKFGKIIVAPRGMLGFGALSIKPLKKKIFLYIIKKMGIFKNIYWHATAETEKYEIISNIGNAKVFVAENLPSAKIKNGFSAKIKDKDKLQLCFISRVNRKKNISFALSVLSKLNKNINIEYDIFGPIDDVHHWNECQTIIKKIPDNIKVEYKGVLKHEAVIDNLKNYHAFLFPTLNENFGHIILESFMAGRPVIISDQTPWRDLQNKNAGWDLPLNENQFIETINQIANMEQPEYDTLCKGAFNLAEEFVNNEEFVEKYKGMFEL